MKLLEQHPLLPHNTFRVEAKAQYYAEFDTADTLRDILRWRKTADPSLPILCIGEGSNLLFTTPLFEGLVLRPSPLPASAAIVREDEVTAWAGIKMDDLVSHTIGIGLYGLENLSWIPGTVGASAVQNIGAYGAEAGRMIQSVHCINSETLEERVFTQAECRYEYRDSLFKHERQWIVTHVTYRLDRDFVPNLRYGNLVSLFADGCTPAAVDVRNAVIGERRRKLPDPDVEGNAGSFFMNPIVEACQYEKLADKFGELPHYPLADGRVKLSAAWLIDQCGWKGRMKGRAGVSARHALILINGGGATGADIVDVCRAIQADVHSRFGVTLTPEVNFL